MIRFALIVAIYYSSADVERVGVYNNVDQCEQAAEKVKKDLPYDSGKIRHSCIPVYE